jgi:hypothetical protein
VRIFGWVCVALATIGSLAYAAVGALALTILVDLASALFPSASPSSGLSLFFDLFITDCVIPLAVAGLLAGALILTRPSEFRDSSV